MADIVAIAALEAAAAKLAAAKRKEKEKEKEKTKLSPFLKDYELPSASLKKKPFDRERDEVSSSGEEGTAKRPRPRTEAELQARQLEKLMRNPEKPVELPARPEKKPPKIREFNLDVMGSSAGAGSGDFHVYRAARRRELERQAYVLEMEQERELKEQIERTRQEREEKEAAKTAKKRKERMRRKLAKKRKVANPDGSNAGGSGSDDSDAGDSGDEAGGAEAAATNGAPAATD